MNKLFIIGLVAAVCFIGGMLTNTIVTTAPLSEQLEAANKSIRTAYEIGLRCGYITRSYGTNKQAIDTLAAAGWQNSLTTMSNLGFINTNH